MAIAAGALCVSASGSADAVACTLLSASQVRAIVGQDHSIPLRNYDPTSKVSEAVNTECDIGAWSGATPTSPAAVFQTARSGHAAQVYVETWAPNKTSTNVKSWPHDYDKLTGGFDKEGVIFPHLFSSHGMPSKHITPVGLGYDRTGMTVLPQGQATGLVAAVGCWWNDKTSSAICLLDEEAANRPVAQHLNQLAKIAVPKFLG
jgi:hypothetical protein